MKAFEGRAAPMPPNAFDLAAAQIGCEPAAVRALWAVESAGRGFRSDGSLERRFEPHHLPRAIWPRIGFDPGSAAPWRASFALGQATRERMFAAAWSIDPEATARATSWGGPQIMGFNHEDAGFSSALDMVRAMAETEAAHLSAFVTLIRNWGLGSALRGLDWQRIETRYNGGGQGGAYARRMAAEYRRITGRASPEILRLGSSGEAVRRLQAALGVAVDGRFGPETDAAVRAFQEAAGLAVDGWVGDRTWSALEARANARAPAAATSGDAGLDRLRDGAAAASAVTAAVAGAREVLPDAAYSLLTIGAVALALVAVAAFLVRRVRRG